MALQLCVLGSGSGGNSTLLRIQEKEQTHHILIDAGLSPKETGKRLATIGIELAQIEAIILTHMHADHFRDAWISVCMKQDIRVFFHRKHARLWWKKTAYDVKVKEFHVRFFITPSTSVRPILLPHDQQFSTGMLFEHEGMKMGFMTDLGHVPEPAFKHFHGMDMLAIESNYDPTMQKDSPRPQFLKQRVMGPLGHLSNEQCIDAIHRFSVHSGLGKILLLHLSGQCNTPKIIEQLYQEQAPHLLEHLHMTHQTEVSPLFELTPAPLSQAALESPLDDDIYPPQMELF